ncbi:hypothetical protein [Halorarius halobius]|uniref:hypothetical protein n=1 Tax=Halorarius halobius TaxID=2962671 RepID=UPI0020CDC845|nr:hypothetical protein [Halorarius halobius]
MTYRTSNVARLAGAASLLAALAGWGYLSHLTAGETTVTTWAVALAALFPVSALLLGAAGSRSPPRTGTAYAVGVAAGVTILSVGYLGAVTADYATVRTLAAVESLELGVAAVGFTLVGGTLALVDHRYVERPVTAALLEERHLDDPSRRQ